MKKTTLLTFLRLLALSVLAPIAVQAADHAEAPLVASDQAADIADVYAFLDPNDNTKVILAFDVHGFIVPGENGNFGGFDPNVAFRLNIESTNDAVPDKQINVVFSAQTSRSLPQTAKISFVGSLPQNTIRFTAPTTVSSPTSLTSPTPTVTTDQASGISFFAGVTDDPFFFDIPGFNRFAASVLAGSADLALLLRGRDTFAGYNIQMIALSVPANLLKGLTTNVIGVSATTLRSGLTSRSSKTAPKHSGPREAVDRMGVPTVATVLIPFARKDEYNRATTKDDATGKFAANIISTLTALGTDNAHITTLANVAVTKGDMLRLDTTVANSGSQGGSTPGAGFPNGRRPTDDVVDTILFLVTNEALTTGDNVDANDVTFGDTFPFFAESHQPLANGVTDDGTRN